MYTATASPQCGTCLVYRRIGLGEFLLAFVVGGLGFEFCVFVAGWRHALRSEWPFIIIIIIMEVNLRDIVY